jgi:hypothetical protein
MVPGACKKRTAHRPWVHGARCLQEADGTPTMGTWCPVPATTAAWPGAIWAEGPAVVQPSPSLSAGLGWRKRKNRWRSVGPPFLRTGRMAGETVGPLGRRTDRNGPHHPGRRRSTCRGLWKGDSFGKGTSLIKRRIRCALVPCRDISDVPLCCVRPQPLPVLPPSGARNTFTQLNRRAARRP